MPRILAALFGCLCLMLPGCVAVPTIAAQVATCALTGLCGE